MIVYFDASALVKLALADEPGRAAVVDLLDVASIPATARVTYPECHAALAAAARAGRLTETQLAQCVRVIQAVDDGLTSVAIDQTVAREAGALAEAHRLRGYDAVHLAAALTLHTPHRPVLFASWDKRLHAAASAAGLTAVPHAL